MSGSRFWRAASAIGFLGALRATAPTADAVRPRILHSFATVVGNHGVRAALAATGRYLADPVRRRLLARVGWYHDRLRRRHRESFDFDIDRYEVPVDPFRVLEVDPDDVTDISPRSWPREYAFGSVKGGDWDQREAFRFEDGYQRAEWKRRDFGSLKFEGTMFFRSVRDHFENGTPWTEMTYFEAAVEAMAEGHMIHDWFTTEAELLADLERTDRIYDAIRANGYRTQVELLRDGASDLADFVDLRQNEIRLDIARDGRLLFAGGGKHRLSIAKVIGLDRVPVVVIRRHARWMDALEEAYSRANRSTTRTGTPSSRCRAPPVRSPRGAPRRTPFGHRGRTGSGSGTDPPGRQGGGRVAQSVPRPHR